MTRAWDKEKFWVPDRNRTHDLPNTGGRSIHWATRSHGEQGHLTEFIYDRCPAYCPKTKEGETIGQGRRWVEKVENRVSSRLETRSVNALGDKSTEGIFIYPWPPYSFTHDLPVFGRSWVRFLSGTQNFSLSHARVMLINSSSHIITELKIHHLY